MIPRLISLNATVQHQGVKISIRYKRKNQRSNHHEENASEENTEDISPSILITELYYDAHPNINAEYVRLLNPTNKTIDVSGWYLTDKPWKEPDDQPKILFPEQTLMPPQTSWFITKNATAFFWETAMLPDFEYAVDSATDMSPSSSPIEPSVSATPVVLSEYTVHHRDLWILSSTGTPMSTSQDGKDHRFPHQDKESS